MRYTLIKHNDLKLLINEGCDIAPLLQHLEEIISLNSEYKSFYQNILNAQASEGKALEEKARNLVSKIGYKIIGTPFSMHDALLYALDKKLAFDELELT